MPFQAGQSGNPAGRPRGARNQTTVLIEQLLEGNAEPITRKLIAQAKEGNPSALGLLMPALLPKRKDKLISIDLPPLEESSDAPGAIATIIAAVCAGGITPSEGTSLIRMVETYVRVMQKTGGAGRRAERDNAADVAAAPTRESQAASAVHDMEQAGAPAQADEPRVNAAPQPCHAVPQQPAGTRSRLRQEVLRTTSPLAQRATPAVIVPSLLPAHASPPAADELPAAA
jgi:hypothetical protein